MPSDFVRTGGLLTDDAVQIVINGTSYQGWTDVDLDSDILNPADGFMVGGTIPKKSPSRAEVRAGAPENAFDDFREGKECDVYLGLDRQMAGVIDEVKFNGDRTSSRIKISGRDKGGYLVDSEAKHIKASQYTVKTLFQALIDPSWGIRNIVVSNEDNRKLLLGKKDKKKPTATAPSFLKPLARSTTKIDPGQRIASIMDLHCRRLGITWWITAQGDLFIGKPNYDQEAAYHFDVPASSDNGSSDARYLVESWEVGYGIAERYSEIRVNGQGFADPKNIWATTKPKPGYTATARDPDLVERGIVRKTIIGDHDILSKSEAQSRADWEMGHRRLKALVINLTVANFRQGDRLYAVDTIATVNIEEAAIDGKFYVLQRRFTENRGKRRTQLMLVQPKVWLS